MNTRKLSTHVLNTSTGKAASNVKVTVYRLNDSQEWIPIKPAQTNADGRCQLLSEADFINGIYKLTFQVGLYFAEQNIKTFYPAIDVIVDCCEAQSYHIPLLISPFGYSTYRGT
ncbi:uncharacterized protein LOC115565691 [Drosophila navojoa]|uniref:uncharacterized protein LOC115565691 n=1 Tax=Drosophila navojoa TaxID=7232 RepID=UPI0011BD76F5|nr:uncharacterized protein LOC115565691 [Drosophila navojoa]